MPDSTKGRYLSSSIHLMEALKISPTPHPTVSFLAFFWSIHLDPYFLQNEKRQAKSAFHCVCERRGERRREREGTKQKLSISIRRNETLRNLRDCCVARRSSFFKLNCGIWIRPSALSRTPTPRNCRLKVGRKA